MNLHFTFNHNKLQFYNEFRRSEIHAVIYIKNFEVWREILHFAYKYQIKIKNFYIIYAIFSIDFLILEVTSGFFLMKCCAGYFPLPILISSRNPNSKMTDLLKLCRNKSAIFKIMYKPLYKISINCVLYAYYYLKCSTSLLELCQYLFSIRNVNAY